MNPDVHVQGQGGDRSLGELFRQLSRDLGTLLRQEAELARVEIGDKAAKAGRSVMALGGGACVAYAGFLFLLLAAVLALGQAFDSPALAALVVGAVTLGAGAALLALGRSQLKVDELTPNRTIDSLRKDAELARSAGSLSGPETH